MKQELRKKILNQRKKIVNKKGKEEKILINLKNIIKKYDKILIYYPISNEPNILGIIKEYSSKSFYLPYSNQESLEIRKLIDINDLEYDKMNILSSKIKTDDMVDVAVVPALAMNHSMYRLGYGKGYYDKFLNDLKVIKIAVVYDQFFINEEYQDEWDVRFDYVVTEERIIEGK